MSRDWQNFYTVDELNKLYEAAGKDTYEVPVVVRYINSILREELEKAKKVYNVLDHRGDEVYGWGPHYGQTNPSHSATLVDIKELK